MCIRGWRRSTRCPSGLRRRSCHRASSTSH
jgi:hypothetical protein